MTKMHVKLHLISMLLVHPAFTVHPTQYNRLRCSLYLKLDIKGGDSTALLLPALPDISGTLTIPGGATTLANGLPKSGAFNQSHSTGSSFSEFGASGLGDVSIVFAASDSNTIYGSSDTVQPPALILLPQIRY